MNVILQEFARDWLKANLPKLSEPQAHTFKLMYAPLEQDIDLDKLAVELPEDKLDWAMMQVHNTLHKKSRVNNL